MNLALKYCLIVLFVFFVTMAGLMKMTTNHSKKNSHTLQKQAELNQQKLTPTMPSDSSQDVFVPADRNPTLQCFFMGQDFDVASPPRKEHWQLARQVMFNNRCTDGLPDGPKTFARFLWSKNFLYFYVEVESIHDNDQHNLKTKLWQGNNIEFLIAPRWHSVPLKDEYEFLFNAAGGLTSLHWTGTTLEESLAWEPKGLEWAVFDKLIFNTEVNGWSFQGRIPFDDFAAESPQPNTYWGLGVYRKNVLNDSSIQLLAWSPTLTTPAAFHTPVMFGKLVFVNQK